MANTTASADSIESQFVKAALLPPKQSQHVRPVLIGASIAAGLALTVVVFRARKKRRPAPDTKSGVLGTIVKSALFAAVTTIAKATLAPNHAAIPRNE